MTKEPLVTILVFHHLDINVPYLHLALEGIRRQHVYSEVIVLSSAPTKPPISAAYKIVHDPELNTATKKVIAGTKMMDPRSKYLLLHSDDVVLSEYALASMLRATEHSPMVVGPLSNSDNGTRYLSDLMVQNQMGEKKILIPDMAIEEFRGFEDPIFKFTAPAHGRLFLMQQPWICFFCVLIPKVIWDKVGGLDEALDSRHNDTDFCYRATQAGFISVIDAGAFALHFGTRTLSRSCLPGEQDRATKHFREKWGIG